MLAEVCKNLIVEKALRNFWGLDRIDLGYRKVQITYGNDLSGRLTRGIEKSLRWENVTFLFLGRLVTEIPYNPVSRMKCHSFVIWTRRENAFVSVSQFVAQ